MKVTHCTVPMRGFRGQDQPFMCYSRFRLYFRPSNKEIRVGNYH